jgi:hypothetical protein
VRCTILRLAERCDSQTWAWPQHHVIVFHNVCILPSPRLQSIPVHNLHKKYGCAILLALLVSRRLLLLPHSAHASPSAPPHIHGRHAPMLPLPCCATVMVVPAGVPCCCDAHVSQAQQGRRAAADAGGAVAVLGACYHMMQRAHVHLCSCVFPLPVASSSKYQRELAYGDDDCGQDT